MLISFLMHLAHTIALFWLISREKRQEICNSAEILCRTFVAGKTIPFFIKNKVALDKFPDLMESVIKIMQTDRNLGSGCEQRAVIFYPKM